MPDEGGYVLGEGDSPMRPTPTLMTTAAVMAKLGFTTPDGTSGFLRRNGIRSLRVGRRNLWRADAVENLIANLERSGDRA